MKAVDIVYELEVGYVVVVVVSEMHKSKPFTVLTKVYLTVQSC